MNKHMNVAKLNRRLRKASCSAVQRSAIVRLKIKIEKFSWQK